MLIHDPCTKRPNFNFEGKRKACCKQHTEDGMMNVRSQLCLHYSARRDRDSFV